MDLPTKRFVVYHRLPALTQKRLDAWLETQRLLVKAHLTCEAGPAELLAEFTEEDNSSASRAKLMAAIAACREHRAELLITHLGELAKDPAFAEMLTECGIGITVFGFSNLKLLLLHGQTKQALEKAEQLRRKSENILVKE